MINPYFRLAEAAAGSSSAIGAFYQGQKAVPQAGTYNEGMVAVVGLTSASTLLRCWTWLLDRDCIPFMTTAFGDVFFWNPACGVCYLDVQRGEVEFIDSEIEWFLQDFLVNSEIVAEVLRKDRFEELAKKKGPLKYHQVFILEPWACLGGKDAVENYSVGDCGVYLDLIGQALQPERKQVHWIK